MGQGLTGDYIRTYLGLMGSGKTTQALRELESKERVIVYSPGSSNPLMHTYPYIYDTLQYLRDFQKYLSMYPKLRIEKRAFPSEFFKTLARVRGYAILLDDVAALKTSGQERADFEAFVRTVRFNGNQVIITTHRANSDLPPLVRTIGTSFFYVGPGTRSKRELDTLYELTNYPVTLEEFSNGLIRNPARSGNRPAGLFPIRKP